MTLDIEYSDNWNFDILTLMSWRDFDINYSDINVLRRFDINAQFDILTFEIVTLDILTSGILKLDIVILDSLTFDP